MAAISKLSELKNSVFQVESSSEELMKFDLKELVNSLKEHQISFLFNNNEKEPFKFNSYNNTISPEKEEIYTFSKSEEINKFIGNYLFRGLITIDRYRPELIKLLVS